MGRAAGSYLPHGDPMDGPHQLRLDRVIPGADPLGVLHDHLTRFRISEVGQVIANVDPVDLQTEADLPAQVGDVADALQQLQFAPAAGLALGVEAQPADVHDLVRVL